MKEHNVSWDDVKESRPGSKKEQQGATKKAEVVFDKLAQEKGRLAVTQINPQAGTMHAEYQRSGAEKKEDRFRLLKYLGGGTAAGGVGLPALMRILSKSPLPKKDILPLAGVGAAGGALASGLVGAIHNSAKNSDRAQEAMEENRVG